MLKFKKIRDEGNVLGHEEFEIIEFNYDGNGSALLKANGMLDSLGLADVNYMMFGDAGTGEKYYDLEN